MCIRDSSKKVSGWWFTENGEELPDHRGDLEIDLEAVFEAVMDSEEDNLGIEVGGSSTQKITKRTFGSRCHEDRDDRDKAITESQFKVTTVSPLLNHKRAGYLRTMGRAMNLSQKTVGLKTAAGVTSQTALYFLHSGVNIHRRSGGGPSDEQRHDAKPSRKTRCWNKRRMGS